MMPLSCAGIDTENILDSGRARRPRMVRAEPAASASNEEEDWVRHPLTGPGQAQTGAAVDWKLFSPGCVHKLRQSV